MQTPRTTRSSVLGKRGHQEPESTPSKPTDQLQTPENTPNPKRLRTSSTVVDGDGNKENIPPFKLDGINSPMSPRATRALRRTVTEAVVASRPSIQRSDGEPLRRLFPQHLVSPTVLLPLHARVKALLRATSNAGEMSMAGRENERAIIQRFLDGFVDDASMQDDVPTNLFISGSPGTGKTALVNSIIRDACKDASFVSIFINCMTLKTVDGLLTYIAGELRSKKSQTSRAKKGRVQSDIHTLLKSLGTKCLLVLDELDHIASNQQALSSLFSLFETTSGSLRVIGIANTHTLTTDSSTCSPIPGTVQTLHFAPYTPTQLQQVLQTRLAPLSGVVEGSDAANDVKKLLPAPSVMLLTKKIANLTGDVRSLFEVLRGAIDHAIAAKKSSSDSNPLNTPPPSVTPQHILAALKAYAPSSSISKLSAATALSPSTGNSEIITKIRNLGLQSRIVLLSLLLASQRLQAGLGLAGVTASPKKPSASPIKRTSSLVSSSPSTLGVETQQLFVFYSNVLDRTDYATHDGVSRSDFGDLLGVLEGVGLVHMSSSSLPAASSGAAKAKRGFSRSASFGAGLGRNGAGTVGEVKLVDGVWTTEVLRGLGISDSSSSDSDLQDEVVKSLWQSESSRLSKEVKSLAAASVRKECVASFDDAFER